jgi:small subunit ribosomal protein S21
LTRAIFPAFFTFFPETGSYMSIEVKIRRGEPMERALRRLKKRLDREGVIRDARAKRYFEKPSEVKRRKDKVAKFNNMLRQRYANM